MLFAAVMQQHQSKTKEDRRMMPALTRRDLFKYIIHKRWETDPYPAKRSHYQRPPIQPTPKTASVPKTERFSLADINIIPDEIMHSIRPMLRKDATVPADILDTTNEPIQIYPQKAQILNMFDGESTIEQIACKLSEEKDNMASEEAYRVVKELFVKLCQEGIAHPADPLKQS